MAATAGATWFYSDLVNETLWLSPGGDFSVDASTQGSVEDSTPPCCSMIALGLIGHACIGVRLILPNLVEDVKDMLANPTKNHGWLLRALIETEAGSGNALR